VTNSGPTSTPEDVIPTIVGLLISGVFLGAFYGLGLVSGLVLDLVFFGVLVVFVSRGPFGSWTLVSWLSQEIGPVVASHRRNGHTLVVADPVRNDHLMRSDTYRP